MLTAEWERKLKQVELGELSASDFMSGIRAFTKALVLVHTAPDPEALSLFAKPTKGSVIGSCPRCGANVAEGKKSFYCSGRECKFALWKDSRFWEAKGKTLDKKTARALLTKVRISFFGKRAYRQNLFCHPAGVGRDNSRDLYR